MVKKTTSAPKGKKQTKGKITIVQNGPYMVTGGLPLAKEFIICDEEGTPMEWAKGNGYPQKENYSLCRCGKSKNKPYCDGMHVKTGFDGTETASREKYLDQADEIDGPDLVLTDAESLCALARFCHRGGDVWNLTENSDDPESREMAVRDAWDCCAGRLAVWERDTGKPIEPKLKPSVSLVEDPDKGVSGPIWVKGGVPIESSDGETYEVRNRVTLCRCGKSENKPFCDGQHILSHFNDGDKSLKD
jgi:CDGSH-type Zn-finger protein